MGNEFEPRSEIPETTPATPSEEAEGLSALYAPEVTERILRLILRLEVPEIVKEHLIANIDSYDRRDLIDMLAKYFSAMKKIERDDARARMELEEARKRLQDSVEADNLGNP